MRGTLTILVLAGAVAVGLWYWLTPADTPTVPQPETAGSADGATPAATGRPQTADSGAASPDDAAPPTTDPGAAGSVPQTAAVEQEDSATDRELVLSPAPEATVEQVPIAAPATDEPGQADLLATVERVIEQVDTAIRERLVPEPEADTDTATPTAPVRTRDAAPAPDVARTAEPEATATRMAEAEAKQYVEMLTAATPQIIPVDKAAHFVTPEHTLSLVPEDTIERVSVGELAKDGALAAETPITVVREVEQKIEAAVPEQLVAESGGDLDTELRVLVEHEDTSDDAGENAAAQPDDVEEITVREALARLLTEPGKPISIIKTVRYFEVMTLKELLDTEEGGDTFLDVVTQPYRLEKATLTDLLQRQKTENPDSVFYLHTVQPTDEQGIWGIVHSGIIDNFARGMAIRRGEEIETYTVRIPKDADERLHDRSSSFLGKLIDLKTKESFVYNYRDDRMGRNPDRIYPGQEIVIIKFEPEELVSIYKQFASG